MPSLLGFFKPKPNQQPVQIPSDKPQPVQIPSPKQVVCAPELKFFIVNKNTFAICVQKTEKNGTVLAITVKNGDKCVHLIIDDFLTFARETGVVHKNILSEIDALRMMVKILAFRYNTEYHRYQPIFIDEKTFSQKNMEVFLHCLRNFLDPKRVTISGQEVVQKFVYDKIGELKVDPDYIDTFTHVCIHAYELLYLINFTKDDLLKETIEHIDVLDLMKSRLGNESKSNTLNALVNVLRKFDAKNKNDNIQKINEWIAMLTKDVGAQQTGGYKKTNTKVVTESGERCLYEGKRGGKYVRLNGKFVRYKV